MAGNELNWSATITLWTLDCVDALLPCYSIWIFASSYLLLCSASCCVLCCCASEQFCQAKKKTVRWKKSLLSSSTRSIVWSPCVDKGNQLDSWNCIVRLSRCGGNESKPKIKPQNTADIICCCVVVLWLVVVTAAFVFRRVLRGEGEGDYWPTLQLPLTLIVVHAGATLVCTNGYTHTCQDFRFIVCSWLSMTPGIAQT